MFPISYTILVYVFQTLYGIRICVFCYKQIFKDTRCYILTMYVI